MRNSALLIIVAVAMVATGCAPRPQGVAMGEIPAAWFDSPLRGSSFGIVDAKCTIVAHGASPAGIDAFELSVNGAATEIENEDNASSLATLSRPCGLTEPGKYELRLRVRDTTGRWSGYAVTVLVIGGASSESTPADRPTPGPDGGVVIESVSEQHIYAGGSNCGPMEVTITARASAPAGIEVVVLFYRFEPGSPVGYENRVMKPIGDDLFQSTLDMESILGRSVPFDLAKLQYQVVIQQKDGDTSVRTPVMTNVEVQACGSAAPTCSRYTSQPSCESHGCQWVLIPGILPVYTCGNP